MKGHECKMKGKCMQMKGRWKEDRWKDMNADWNENGRNMKGKWREWIHIKGKWREMNAKKWKEYACKWKEHEGKCMQLNAKWKEHEVLPKPLKKIPNTTTPRSLSEPV